ncbi:MAG: metal-sensing transcriptional repressor, partial [Firmicutes bacterium]|nr:metal-sensing transcriptional repressor [Bacillota bacterium]
RVGGRGKQLAPGERAALLRRRRRLRGRVRTIARLVDQEAECTQILREITAARRALRRITLRLVQREVGECLRLALRDDPPDPVLERLFQVLDRLTRNRQ